MNIAIIGCGQISDAHLQEISRISGAEVIAVCDKNWHLAEQAARRFEVNGVYTDITKMITEEHPDVIHITTPPTTHYAIAKNVLKLGCHIYMEKPFTSNLGEAEEIIHVAEQKGLQICVGHNSAFDPSYLRLSELVTSGKLGDIVHLNTGMGYGLGGPFGKVMMGDPNHWVHKLPGGIPQNNISHPISLILGIMKEKNVKVHAYGYKWREVKYGDIRDSFYDELRVSLYGNSASANIVFSAKIAPMELYLDTFGTKAIARLNVNSRTLVVDAGSSFPGPFAKVQWARNYFKETKKEYRHNLKNLFKSNLYYFDGMKILFERFYDSINTGSEMPIPMSEALRATKIIDDIFRNINS